VYYYVYIIQSDSDPSKTYIGFTSNIKKRLAKHNEGGSNYTSKYKPWKIKLAIAFNDKQKALSSERYLKSHSGRAFTKRHF
jgi:predicted GIY-YIG superfamily endonuclease